MTHPENWNFIFIGGNPRSGTSLIQKIIGFNSKVYGGPEFDFLPNICNLHSEMKHGIRIGRQIDYYNEDYLKKVFHNFIQSLFEQKTAIEKVAFLSEKTPANVRYFEHLSDLFPEAKFVHVVRDPRAIYNSYLKVQKRKRFGNSFTQSRLRFLSDLTYNVHLGDTFQEKYPERCITVHYESVVTNSESEIQRICDFLGIPYSEDMLDTTVKNDSSKLIENAHPSVSAFYTSEMYDRKISTSSMDSWEKELSKFDILMLNHIIKERNLSSWSVYKIGKSSKLIYLYFYLADKISNWIK